MFLKGLRRGRNCKLRHIPADDILPNPHQPRKNIDEAGLVALCESIRANGIITPLAVVPKDDGFFQLVSGERRLLAARRAGVQKLPCVILPPNEQIMALYPLIEGAHTQIPDIFEQGVALRRYMDSFRLSRHTAAMMLGISESAVSARLSVLRLNDAQRARAMEAGLELNYIKAIASMPPEKRDKALDSVISRREMPQNERAEPEKVRKISGVADLRFFDNSINRIMDSLSSAGIHATCSRRSAAGYSEYVIRINRAESGDKQLTLF